MQGSRFDYGLRPTLNVKGWRPVLGACLAVLLSAGTAVADERFDHRGAVGLLLGTGGEYASSGLGTSVVQGLRLDADVGGTYAIGVDGNELMLLGRASIGGPSIDWSATFGYRGYFGQDRFKTFFDLGVAAHLTPAFVLGPRVGFGAQYELTQVIGVYAGLAAQLGFGGSVRFDGELNVGLQLRSYLLE